MDLLSSKIYYSDFHSGEIFKANLDGSDAELILSGLQKPVALALDLERSEIYWTTHGDGKIEKMSISISSHSSSRTVVARGLSFPSGVVLDIAGSQLYVSQWLGNEFVAPGQQPGTDVAAVSVILMAKTRVMPYVCCVYSQ